MTYLMFKSPRKISSMIIILFVRHIHHMNWVTDFLTEILIVTSLGRFSKYA